MAGSWKKPSEVCDREDYILSRLNKGQDDKFPADIFWTPKWKNLLLKHGLINSNVKPGDPAFLEYTKKMLAMDPNFPEDLATVINFVEWIEVDCNQSIEVHLKNKKLIPVRWYNPFKSATERWGKWEFVEPDNIVSKHYRMFCWSKQPFLVDRVHLKNRDWFKPDASVVLDHLEYISLNSKEFKDAFGFTSDLKKIYDYLEDSIDAENADPIRRIAYPIYSKKFNVFVPATKVFYDLKQELQPYAYTCEYADKKRLMDAFGVSNMRLADALRILNHMAKDLNVDASLKMLRLVCDFEEEYLPREDVWVPTVTGKFCRLSDAVFKDVSYYDELINWKELDIIHHRVEYNTMKFLKVPQVSSMIEQRFPEDQGEGKALAHFTNILQSRNFREAIEKLLLDARVPNGKFKRTMQDLRVLSKFSVHKLEKLYCEFLYKGKPVTKHGDREICIVQSKKQVILLAEPPIPCIKFEHVLAKHVVRYLAAPISEAILISILSVNTPSEIPYVLKCFKINENTQHLQQD